MAYKSALDTSGIPPPPIPSSVKNPKKDLGALGRRGGKKKAMIDTMPESEKDREDINYFKESGITKDEWMFSKWLKQAVDFSATGFLEKLKKPIAPTDIPINPGFFLSIEQKKLLAYYFNICIMSKASETNLEVKERYEIMRHRMKARTPFEIASMMLVRDKEQQAVKEDTAFFETISNPTALTNWMKSPTTPST